MPRGYYRGLSCQKECIALGKVENFVGESPECDLAWSYGTSNHDPTFCRLDKMGMRQDHHRRDEAKLSQVTVQLHDCLGYLLIFLNRLLLRLIDGKEGATPISYHWL